MEYWIVYDLASGKDLWRGSGSFGSAISQQLPEGAGLVVVPQAVIASPALDLNALRAALALQVDTEAERVRQLFLTPGAGQAMTYARKEAEARAWQADDTAVTPFLSAEAPARGMTVAALAAEVITLSDAWTSVGALIEGLRMGAKTQITAAETLGAIVAAGNVEWGTLGTGA